MEKLVYKDLQVIQESKEQLVYLGKMALVVV
jgi:hypothetical protein